MFSEVIALLLIESVNGCCIDSCNVYGVDCQYYQDRGHTTSGVYHVNPEHTHAGYDVYCDMTTDGGGWLVFQRRLNGSLDFYRGWREYERGFGEPDHEYWLGLLPLKAILSQGYYELRIDLTDFEGNSTYANYDHFEIEDFKENYKLTVADYTGTAGDSLILQNGYMFSTKDRDNDVSDPINCAENFKGAWWYAACYDSNLNGLYFNDSYTAIGDGINWKTWRGYNYSLKKTEMKIRRIM